MRATRLLLPIVTLIVSVGSAILLAGCTVAGAAAGVIDPGFIQSPVAMTRVAALKPGTGISVTMTDHRSAASKYAVTPRGAEVVTGDFVRIDEETASLVIWRMKREQPLAIAEIDKVERDNTLWSILGGAITGAIVDVVILTFVGRDLVF